MKWFLRFCFLLAFAVLPLTVNAGPLPPPRRPRWFTAARYRHPRRDPALSKRRNLTRGPSPVVPSCWSVPGGWSWDGFAEIASLPEATPRAARPAATCVQPRMVVALAGT